MALTVERWRTDSNGVRVKVSEVLVPKSRAARFAGTTVRHPFGGQHTLCTECYGYQDDTRHYLPAQAQYRLDQVRLRDGRVIDDRRARAA